MPHNPDLDPDLDNVIYTPRHRPSPYGCSDRMCGADDCKTCHPENFNAQNEYLYSDED